MSRGEGMIDRVLQTVTNSQFQKSVGKALIIHNQLGQNIVRFQERCPVGLETRIVYSTLQNDIRCP